MIDGDLNTIADTLAAASTWRVRMIDGESGVQAVDQALSALVLRNYQEQLADLSPHEAVSWLVERLARIEAQLLMARATAAAEPAAAEPAIGAVAIPEPRRDEVLVAQPTSATLLFDQSITQSGFYATEFDERGRPFRWLGPSPIAHVFVPKIAGPLKIQLRVASARLPDLLRQVRVSLDGGDWLPVEVDHRLDAVVLIARSPVASSGSAATMKVEIDVVRTESPSEHGEPDVRKLGVALASVSLTSD